MPDKSANDWRRDATPLITLGYIGTFHYLKDVARGLGYALAIHGSVSRDLDIVAVPWTDGAVAFETLVGAFAEATGAALSSVGDKPHGRRAVLLSLPHGAVIDLSVFPLKESTE